MASSKLLVRALGLKLDELNIEDEGGVGRDDAAKAARACIAFKLCS